MRAIRPAHLLAIALALVAMAWMLRPAPQPTQEAQATQAQGAGSQPAQPRGMPPQGVQSPRQGAATTADAGHPAPAAATLPSFMPAEALPVIRRIQRGDHFPHRQDGSVFGNRERRLPARGHGWYREYTVPTPGLSHRGARRIVTGGDPPSEWFYTADHYATFRAFDPPASEAMR